MKQFRIFNGKRRLDYPGEFNAITRVWRRREGWRQRRHGDGSKEDLQRTLIDIPRKLKGLSKMHY